ncbi:MAG TPA: MFS transporter [Ktedonobacteraceae bacterium]|nr:MFS transporter [Ktedonobacteraceae bacterium]
MSMPIEPPDAIQQDNAAANLKKGAFAGGILAPLKVRNFQLLFGGQMISTIGDAFYAVALPWLVLTSGGNPQELGIILSAYGVPRLLSILIGGILSDRFRPRRVMLVADAVRAVLVGILAFLALQGHPTFWQLLAVAIPLGIFEGVFLPATFSMLPEVLEKEQLQAGNALNTTTTQLASLIGSSLGGIVVSVLKSGVALALDAFSFVVSAVSLLLIRGKSPSGSAEIITAASELTASAETTTIEATQEATITFWQLVRASRVIQVAFLVALFANLAFGGLIEVAIPTLAHGPLAAGASGFGLILAGYGAGAFAGGIVAGMLSNIPHRGTFALLMGVLQAVFIVLIPYGGLAGAVASMAAMGICNSLTNVFFITIIQQIIPNHLLGRVMSVIMFASLGSYPLSVAVTGVIVAHYGATIMFPITGAFLSAAAIFGLLQKELREL